LAAVEPTFPHREPNLAAVVGSAHAATTTSWREFGGDEPGCEALFIITPVGKMTFIGTNRLDILHNHRTSDELAIRMLMDDLRRSGLARKLRSAEPVAGGQMVIA
jgi:hypothetical protein